MLRSIHQSKHSQLIPGINREDENIKLTHGERCFISDHGDGLSYPQKLIADATNAQQRGRHTKQWNEYLSKLSEEGISEAYKGRDSKLRQWKELLNREVDSLAEEIQRIEEYEREVCRQRQYFNDLCRTSQATADFRKRIPEYDLNDEITNLQKKEISLINAADDDMQQCSKDLKECERKLKSARSALMSDVEAKAMTLNVNKRCQHSVPLLTFPYIPENHPSDQIYHPNTDDDWEKNLEDKMQMSLATRQEASKARCRTDLIIKNSLSCTADAWYRTSKALIEAVQRDERSVYNIKALLKTIGENISSTRHRISSLYDDLRKQDVGKNLQLWRLQMMTYRPGPDHIRDKPIRKLDEEVQNSESKLSFINENLNRNKALLQELIDEKQKQTLDLENLTKKLFIERENCLGQRRTLTIEGL